MAFNAKNLNYERKDPPFLQKLRGTYGGDNAPQQKFSQRPRKPQKEEDDDAPTYVDEETNETISKEEYDALVRGDERLQTTEDEQVPKDELGRRTDKVDVNEETPKSHQRIAEIGGQKKRKQVKVVDEENLPKEERDAVREDTKVAPKKQKQKKKKIKLSFNDDEQE